MTDTIFIYWLLDMRPETIAAGHHSGYPFYCGKTIDPASRLQGHLHSASLMSPRSVEQRVAKCGGHVRMQIMREITRSHDWRSVERHWIRLLRFSFPDNCNIQHSGEYRPTTRKAPERVDFTPRKLVIEGGQKLYIDKSVLVSEDMLTEGLFSWT